MLQCLTKGRDNLNYSTVNLEDVLKILMYNGTALGRSSEFTRKFTNGWYLALAKTWASYFNEIKDTNLPHAFQKPLHFERTTIWFTINVDCFLDKKPEQILKMRRTDFVGDNTSAIFEKMDGKSHSHGAIAMMPWPIDGKNLVVDGNHRVNDFLNSECKVLNAYLYSFQDSRKAFSTHFEEAFYCYTFEFLSVFCGTVIADLMSESLANEFL